jgi:Cd2+/Zn2+-exporting ATPase
MIHKHKYDANGKQLSCPLEENPVNKTLHDTGCCSSPNEPENHSDDDYNHNHSKW